MEKRILFIDEDHAPVLTKAEQEAIRPIIEDFVDAYCEDDGKTDLKLLLEQKMAAYLPDHSKEQLKEYAREIISTIKLQEEKLASLQETCNNGRPRESWFANEMKKATSHMANVATMGQYLQGLDEAVQSANEKLAQTVLTQGGLVSGNPNLDGFIAEQYHAQTFNMNAELNGSMYRAEVLEPTGAYGRNSVDIVIKDADNIVKSRYQAKYCQDSEATLKAFTDGDYRGQQKLVPAEQLEALAKKDIKATNVLKAPDGTTSNPLTKIEAKQSQQQAQREGSTSVDWNEYNIKDLAQNIGKQAALSGALGAGLGVLGTVVSSKLRGEKVKTEKVVQAALEGGANAGIKAAVAGGLKVAVEKDMIKAIAKGTPAGTLANIAHVAVENAKILYKAAKGELTPKEALNKMTDVTVSAAAGCAAAAKGAAIGTKIGACLGPAGATVGMFIGGTIGYMAGSKVGSKIVEAGKKVCTRVVETVKSAARTVGNAMTSVARSVGRAFRAVFSW